MKKIVALFLCFLMVSVFLSGCSKEITVDTTGLVNIQSSGETISKTKESYSTVLTADMYYKLPQTVTVAVDGEVLTAGYVYNPSTGELMISEDAVTGNITISAKADSLPVSVDTQQLLRITVDNSTEGLTMQDCTFMLVPDAGYLLPESISVSVDGKDLDSGFTYDPATGALTISGKHMTGDVKLSAKATAEIVGIWQGSFDFATVLNMLLEAEDPNAATLLQFHDLPLNVRFEFRDDDTASMTFDKESFLALEGKIKEQTKEGIIAMFEAIVKEAGLDMSVEELLSSSGMNLDVLLEQEMGGLFTADQLEEMDTEGPYRIVEGHLYLMESPKEGTGIDYTLDGNTLTLGSEDISEELAFLFPLKLEKVEK